ncbi:DUF1727 domain-containing protein, partial [Candidatus Roizmanbacteria bacterium]|nr:DUF1727 domain-containing protein [Candidatus Roizmanbacteria bacterium]
PLDHVINHIHVSIEGVHNKYNAAAALLAVDSIGINPDEELLHSFIPAFGRMEEIKLTNQQGEEKRAVILLSKNPTGFNQNIKLLTEKNGVGSILLVLNNRIPDGRDVSWIWDVDFGPVVDHSSIIVSGDRVWDLALRIKYKVSSIKYKAVAPKNKTPIQQYNNITIEEDLKKAIATGLKKTNSKSTLYILPTYSAMLEVRKILLGRKLL